MSFETHDFGTGNTGNAILSAIFGDNWHSMYSEGPTSAIAQLLVDIFTIYNTAVMLGASIIVGYAIWSGTIQTAHEGKSLGRRFSSLWLPLRMVAGAALVAPVHGISMIQIIVMSLCSFGFFAADQVSSKVASFVSSGNPLTTFPAFFERDKDAAVLAILQLETCAAFNNKNANEVNTSSGQVVIIKEEGKVIGSYIVGSEQLAESVHIDMTSDTLQYGKKAFWGFGDGNACGSIRGISEYNSLVRWAMEDVAKILRPVANAIVLDQPDIDKTPIQEAKNRLNLLDKQLAMQAKIDIDEDTKQSLALFASDVNTKGWIGLGSWYMTLSRNTAKFNEKVSYTFEIKLEDFAKPAFQQMGSMYEYILAAVRLAQNAGITLEANVDNNMQKIAGSVIGLLQGTGDPFLKIVQLGHYCTQASAALAAGGVIVGAVSIFGGELTSAIADFVSLGSFGTTIVILLLAVGVGAGWVLPFIPYAIWVFGVCSVLIGILQSFLAAPIWAAAHVLPEGEGIAGQHTRQGYMLVMNLVLRPILITLGFIFSYFVLWSVCWLFLEGLKMWVVSNSQDTPGLDWLNFAVGITASLGIATISCYFIAVRSFGFIFEAADEVLTWVGGAAQMGADKGYGMKAANAVLAAPGQAGRAWGGSRGTAQAAHGAAGAVGSKIDTFRGRPSKDSAKILKSVIK